MYIRIQLLITILLTSIANAAPLAGPTQVVVRTDSGQAASVTVTPVTPGAAASAAAGANACSCRDKDLLPFQKGLVLLPVVLAVLLFLFVYRVLKQGGYKLADALSENDTRVAAVAASTNAPNPSGQPTNNAQQVQEAQTAQTVPGNRSASRLVLFLSGITAILISVCITTYYLYYYLCCGQPPDLDGLISVMMTLGIGVIPYAVNRVTQPEPASR